MKLFTLLFLLLFTTLIYSQNISGKAYYESKTTVDLDAFGGGREITPEMKNMIAERMKSMLEKTYILTFSNKESIYKEEEKLETGQGNPGFKMMMGSFTPGPQYKNIETNILVEENEFFGKQFLVKDTIQTLKWELGKESKTIGNYIVFKATAIKMVNPNDFSMARPRGGKRNAGDKGESEVKKDSTDIVDPMDEIEIPKEVVVTAWYTPQIPVGQGPGEYSGLPGLILELNVYRTTLLCSKIVMNPKESEKIEAPTKGKEVTREEYTKIVKEKTEEMRENFKGGRGGGRRFGGQ
ncbi:GLPGLI family protein [Ulvibacter antarcticus]|uniref:GLPGLI family protein n=1 Tax=Ulvibacter antarcticus TaxID=442714 RepID=A0A3L9YDW1_9FLAO|nr:GLPGLI family protein [Ulvibacter antarcticus]RMA57630.1 GLPGLI family protein [Ulvibacter antarcticus]